MESIVSVENGSLRGVRAGNVTHYRAIPYAEAGRFGEPLPAPAWQGTRDASHHGPSCPQPPSRLAPVMGEPLPTLQDENCLTLSVATSTTASESKKPVMVWFHGGAYVIGAGSYEWYRPDSLVAEGDVVVVNVNYRIGLFGYLRVEGLSSGNLGLLDQIAALGWVKRNIAVFGGDPECVTVFGESAGAHSVAALMSTGETRGLFRRAILQSGHLGLGFMTVARAERVASTIRRYLGGVALENASVDALLTAQLSAVVKLGGPAGLNSAPVFGPVAGVAPLPRPACADITEAVIHEGVDLLIGCTREEMRAFFDSNPRVAGLRRVPLLGDAFLAALTRVVTDRVFAAPARRLADARARAGASVFTYLFEWAPENGGFGACHTIELPFVFGNEAAWRDAPMLAGTPWSKIDILGGQIRRAWTRFAQTGDPNAEGDPVWRKHSPGADPGRRFA